MGTLLLELQPSIAVLVGINLHLNRRNSVSLLVLSKVITFTNLVKDAAMSARKIDFVKLSFLDKEKKTKLK